MFTKKVIDELLKYELTKTYEIINVMESLDINLGRALRDLFSGFSTRYGALIAAELDADEHKTAVVLDEYIRKLLSESRELIDREL